MTAQLKVSQILDKAADTIEHNGLIAGRWWEPTGNRSPLDCPMCTGGALAVAAGFFPGYAADREATGAYADAVRVLARRLGVGLAQHRTVRDVLLYGIAPWNDANRTAEEVVRELRAAAEQERGLGR